MTIHSAMSFYNGGGDPSSYSVNALKAAFPAGRVSGTRPFSLETGRNRSLLVRRRASSWRDEVEGGVLWKLWQGACDGPPYCIVARCPAASNCPKRYARNCMFFFCACPLIRRNRQRKEVT